MRYNKWKRSYKVCNKINTVTKKKILRRKNELCLQIKISNQTIICFASLSYSRKSTRVESGGITTYIKSKFVSTVNSKRGNWKLDKPLAVYQTPKELIGKKVRVTNGDSSELGTIIGVIALGGGVVSPPVKGGLPDVDE